MEEVDALPAARIPSRSGNSVNPVRKAMRAYVAFAVWQYRRTNGRSGGVTKGIPTLLLTVAGRKTGAPHTVPVVYFEQDGAYLVAASAGGMKSEPQWVRNLEAAGRARIEIREQTYEVDGKVMRDAERDDLWQHVVLARAPIFATYEQKSGRVIPVARLTTR